MRRVHPVYRAQAVATAIAGFAFVVTALLTVGWSLTWGQPDTPVLDVRYPTTHTGTTTGEAP